MGASLVALLLLCVGVAAVGADVNTSAACGFPAIFNFGDSNSDTGSMSAVFNRLPPPNGMTYFHRPAGRYCDGLLIIDRFAQHLGFSFLHPYVDSIGAKFRQGANFAASGATAQAVQHVKFARLEDDICPFSLDKQQAQFSQLQDRSSECRKEGCRYQDEVPKSDVFSKALYTFDIGQNDLAYGFLKLQPQQVPATIPDILAPLSNTIQSLYSRGARYFWIHNTGPIGCLPGYVINGLFTNLDKDQHGCAVYPNKVAMEFNRQLKELVKELRSKLPLAELTYVDIYSAKYKLISEATKLGFLEPLNVCSRPCADPTKYVSWDGIHYSHAANQLIAREVVDGSFSDPPVALAKACRRMT